MHDSSLSRATPNPAFTTASQKAGLALIALCSAYLFFAWWQAGTLNGSWPVLSAFALLITGIWLFVREERIRRAGRFDDTAVWFSGLSARGVWAWMLGIVLTEFYVLLYWAPAMLSGLIRWFDPLSYLLTQKPADQWFLYGTLYTAAVLIMGVRFILKYRHNRYQVLRTISVCFFQLGFAYLIPSFMKMMNSPEYYFSYFWPLKDWYGRPDGVQYFVSQGNWGIFLILFGAFMAVIAVPVLTYFYGKRWYCSWVCGCGGLAETAGDPFRHLSDKSLKAWKVERWMVHGVLVLVTLMTGLLWVNSATAGGVFGGFSQTFAAWYGFMIGTVFSGVIGVGFYPLMGSRVWCRFGCPQAAILGLFQRKKSKFRITVNGGQCISCGNCSTYCEMGIDVRHYAQRGQDVVRASCVGCGICADVCPRGVLRLEGAEADIDLRTTQLRTEVVKTGGGNMIGDK